MAGLGNSWILNSKIFPHNAWESLPNIWQHFIYVLTFHSPGLRVIIEVGFKSEYVGGAYVLNPNSTPMNINFVFNFFLVKVFDGWQYSNGIPTTPI